MESLLQEGMETKEAAKQTITFAADKSARKRGAGTLDSIWGSDVGLSNANLDVSFFLWVVDKTVAFAAVDSPPAGGLLQPLLLRFDIGLATFCRESIWAFVRLRCTRNTAIWASSIRRSDVMFGQSCWSGA
jgi:hypothetical protein